MRNSSISVAALASLAALHFGGVAAPQSQADLDKVRVDNVGTATIQLATGAITRGDTIDKTAGLASAFVNTDTSGFYGIGSVTNSTTGNLIEWLDFGTVTTATGSDIIGSFTFGYGTSATDPTLGGPGAQVTLRFYDGITGFCADSGAAPTASFSFTGLPGASPGAGAGWLITADLTGGFEFCSAGVGVGFGFGFSTSDDDGTGTRQTGPLLCYAGDPNGPNMSATTDPDSNGQLDVFDQWDDSPVSNLCLGTFFFGGTPSNFSSWYLTVETADTTGAATASTSFRNGSGVNPANYTVQSPPVLGGTFNSQVVQANGGLGAFLVGYATPLTFPTQWGELLVNVADPGGTLISTPPDVFVFDPITLHFWVHIWISVPKNLNLCGATVSTQAVEFGGGIQLHNAQDLVIGF